MFSFPGSEFVSDELLSILTREEENSEHQVECKCCVVEKNEAVHGVIVQQDPSNENFQDKSKAVDKIDPLKTNDGLDLRFPRNLSLALEEVLDVDSSGDKEDGDNQLVDDSCHGQILIPVFQRKIC